MAPNHVSGNRVDVDPAIAQQLAEFFRPLNVAHAEQLGTDLNWRDR